MSTDDAHPRSVEPDRLPADIVLVRTTSEFDHHSAPAGFARAHRIAAGVWGRLVVRQGRLGFRFEDDEEVLRVAAPGMVVIPPQRPHRLVLDEPVRFVVEFYQPDPG